MHLFYTPEHNPFEDYFLEKEESSHCIKVLRLKEGDFIYLSNGFGDLHKVEIIDANPNRCAVRLVSSQHEFGKREFYLHIAIAPTKNISRLEWFIEKATEMGIDEISPIITEHSERIVIKPQRLEKVIVSAMKQSLKAYKPILNETRKFEDLILQSKEENKLIGYCSDKESKSKIKDIYTKNQSVLVVIGPEGDFSQREVDIAKENGFEIITMGNSRLRTETAGLYSLFTIHSINL